MNEATAHFLRRSPGSVSTPVKRALIEMRQFGALRCKEGRWVSANNIGFRTYTIQSLLAWGLVILSVNKDKPGLQFVRLTDSGIVIARAIEKERAARKHAQEASEKLVAEISRLQRVQAATTVYAEEDDES